MPNLSEHIPLTRDWIQKEAEEIGWDNLISYYNRLYYRLLTMKCGEKLFIAKEVHPENHELFIKCTCACIDELASQGILGFSIENNATVIEKRYIHTKKRIR